LGKNLREQVSACALLTAKLTQQHFTSKAEVTMKGSRKKSQQATHARRASRTNINQLKKGVGIDGSFKEGGGQILRNASALGVITQQRIYVDNIRSKRPKPGLRPQHLTGLELMADICGGVLMNGEVGSTIVNLDPGRLTVGNFSGDCVTAGSVTLLIQSILPCLLFATPDKEGNEISTVELRGGTDVGMAPPIDYLRYVLMPLLKSKFGIDMEIDLVRRGFNPVGGGIVRLKVRCLPKDQPLPAIDLTDPGTISLMTIHSFAAGRFLVAKGEQQVVNDAVNDLKALFGMSIEDMLEIHTKRETDQTAVESGAGCCIVAQSTTGQIFGSTGMTEIRSGRKKAQETSGDRRKSSAGSDAAFEIYNFIEKNTGVDDWMQDQLILFMALASGTSRIRVWGPTSHTETAIHVVQQLTKAKFRITMDRQSETAPTTWIIECEGIGMTR